MQILVVDDDSLACEMTAAVVESVGHDVLLAENAVDAMEKLSAAPGIAMVISDMNMPLVSGIDLFRELRSQGVKLPFILLTGDNPDGLLQEEPTLDGCMTKDFSIEETLPQMIADVMARYAANSGAY
ncbi:MAG: response regulator [Methylovulum sp.]|nr:response regulator [Methylovulum sp.]